ncbi:HDIG domain-containing metalloprotein [Aminivibrio sp.]|uniref:HD family phosphohydrolase n=1 Tax=Aminivibrio sp. TaxID=1872489 RepID=UPI001A3F1AD0|nr:HDIG domain-containing metalloprotein [Aminivibrio sp.]MBL3538318.1 HDIG domain-containing protein [Aminivibrio sp.]
MTEQYPLFRTSGVLILIVFALSIVLLRWVLTDRVNGFVLGEPSPRSYFALYPMSYRDDDGTRVLRSRVGETVAGVLVRDGAAMDRLIVKIEAMAKGDVASLSLSPGLTELLESLPEDGRKKILTEAARISSDFLKSAGGDTVPLTPAPELIWKEIEKLSLPMEENNVIFQILDEILHPLTRIDNDLTETLRGELAESLQPVERTVAPGDVLIEKGQTVTPQVARILKMQGYSQMTFPWKQILFALLALPFWPLWVLLQTTFRPSARQNIPWLYLSFVVGLSWVVEYFSSMFNVQGMGSLFLAGCAYLTLPPGLALPVVMGGSILGGIVVTGLSALHVVLVSLMGIISSLAGYHLLREVHSRGHLWRQLFLLGLIQAGVGLFIRWAFDLGIYPELLLYLLLGNAGWSTLVIAVLPLLENTFDVLSPLRLMELSHPSNPLLKKLQIEAPGTYHHSLMLGTLAEVVADKLGMNSNLLKAGAYFHDIGKLRRPQFFVENQMGNVNIHDELKPSLSALVIIAHIREGLELAEEYHLPEMIRAFIAEHHGTTCLSYFYRKARRMGLSVPRDQFCYPGPRPRTRETGLLMLVDSIEAAVRAEMRASTSVPDLEKTIEGVVEAKLSEGQLDDIDFTIRDLAVIRQTLLYAFQSMYHTRKVKEIQDKDQLEQKLNKQEEESIEGSLASR